MWNFTAVKIAQKRKTNSVSMAQIRKNKNPVSSYTQWLIENWEGHIRKKVVIAFLCQVEYAKVTWTNGKICLTASMRLFPTEISVQVSRTRKKIDFH